MNDRPIQATPTVPAPGAPAPRAATAPVTPAGGPAPSGDRLALGRKAPPIEADLRLSMRGTPELAADGTVKVQRAFLERFIKKLLADKRTFPKMALGFDAGTKRYTSEGTVRWHGIPVPVAIAAHPVVVGDRLGVKFEAPQLLIGPWRINAPFLKGLATGAIMAELRKTHLHATRGADAGTVLLAPASILHELGVAPPYISLDMKRTTMTAALGPTGDLTLGLKADGVPDAPVATPRSDLALAADEAAITALMRSAVGPDYELKAIALREGGAAVRGKAEFRPVSDTLNLAKGLLVLAALRGGQGAGVVDANPVSVKGDLDLDVKVEGRQMIIKPSISLAVREMLRMLEKAGIPATKVPGGVKIDMDAAAATLGATLGQIRVDEHGVTIQGGVDVERLLRDPRLLEGG